jgi:hypothetical protein
VLVVGYLKALVARHGLTGLDGVCGKIDRFTGFLRTEPGVDGVGRLA